MYREWEPPFNADAEPDSMMISEHSNAPETVFAIAADGRYAEHGGNADKQLLQYIYRYDRIRGTVLEDQQKAYG